MMASIPVMITNKMRADLRAFGISEADIDGMTPAQAWGKLQAQAVLERARAYLAAGLSVIPVGADKRPTFKWDAFQNKRATARQLQVWFEQGGNLAIVGGQVSGGLMVLDFDSEEMFQRFCGDHLALLEGLPVVRTGHGYHVYLKCDEPGGNRKLATVAGKKVIETRGEGGYVLAPPSVHPDTHQPYTTIGGDLCQIPARDMQHVAKLLEACRGYDDTPKKRPTPPASPPTATDRRRRYALAALASESERVRNAPDGDRNNQLNRSGFSLAQLVAGGELDRGEVEGVLAAAARARGLADSEILPTLKSAFEQGMLKPRTAPAQPTNGHHAPAAASAAAPARDEDEKVTRAEVVEFLIVSWRGLTLYDPKAGKSGTWRRWNGQAWVEVTEQSLLYEAKLAMLALGGSRGMITSAALEDILKQCTLPDDMRRDSWNAGAGVYFANGRLDPDAQTFEAHTPSNFNTAALPYDWQPNAKCPKWQAHVKRTVPDIDGRRALAEHLALALAGDTSFHKALVLMGPPRSGKSVIAEVARAALGDMAAETSAILFRENDSESGKRAIRLRHSRLVTIDELPPDTLESDSIFKRMAAHGKVEVRDNYSSADDFRWRAKFLFSSNVAPRIFDRSGAVAARLMFIECPNSLLKTPQLVNLRLAREIIAAELAGVAVWALSTYPDLVARKAYSESAAMQETGERVVLDSDPLQVFLEETCSIKADQYAEAPALYKAWKAWALENGYQPGSRVTFKHNLEASHLTSQGKHPVTRRTVWLGLGLKAEQP